MVALFALHIRKVFKDEMKFFFVLLAGEPDGNGKNDKYYRIGKSLCIISNSSHIEFLASGSQLLLKGVCSY